MALKETQEIIRLFPYIMQEKIRGYLDYVNDVLYEVALEFDVYEKRGEIQYQVEIIFILKFLYDYFSTGYQNVNNSLTYFSAKGAKSFSIGRSEFSKNSKLLSDWRAISDNLNKIIDTMDEREENSTNNIKWSEYIFKAESVENIIRQIIKNNSKPTDQDEETETG